MSDLPKAYEPQKYEDEIYKNWEQSGFFNPDKLANSKGQRVSGKKNKPSAISHKQFAIVMPPPNVTGTLHLGHAVMLALEDIMTRFHRMRGDDTVWIPGTDHAAIATQTKVEKLLFEKTKQTRHDLGREKFLEEVQKFAEDSKNTIHRQIRKMGASCDWSRESYTLDDGRNLAVRTAFKQMYDDGLIYRGERVINWCPRCQSTLADDEVVHTPRKGKIWTFKYSEDFPFRIATTRPETKLGDTAVAVNPKDSRYKKFIGKTFKIDFVGQELNLKIVGDAVVDSEFGTGAVGVTPAHSQIDADIAARHKLSSLKVIDEDGKITGAAKAYSGLSVLEAREKILEKLRTENLLEKEEEVDQNVATCYRCESVIEPLPKLQWFINVNCVFKFRQSKRAPIKGLKDGESVTLKKLMQYVVKTDQIKIIPERFTKTYFHWIDNLRDWNISRQIWFGHQVPVWYKAKTQGLLALTMHDVYVGVEAPKGDGWTQDQDTLDTWFSSGLWTFSTLGWPLLRQGFGGQAKSKTSLNDLERFHPTAVLETGYDILFFWVARMILMTTYLLGEVPFSNVYLHGLVRDEKGRKMSKSLGNVIDPLTVSEKYGTDAVRLSLVLGTAAGNDVKLSEDKIAGFRNFTNKLWNIGRYVLTQLESGSKKQESRDLSLADKWLWSRLNNVIKEVTEDIDKFEFSRAGEKLRDFTWNEYADWYLEINKIEKNNKELLSSFLVLLKLWHPFMPFVTEHLYSLIINDQRLTTNDYKKFIMIENWPEYYKETSDIKALKDFKKLEEVIRSVRNIKSIYKIEPTKPLKIYIFGQDAELFKEAKEIIERLSRSEVLKIGKDEIKPKGSVGVASGQNVIYVVLEGVVDFVRERERLSKDIAEIEKNIKNLEAKLQNSEFVHRAPEEVVIAEKARLSDEEEKLAALKNQLKQIQ